MTKQMTTVVIGSLRVNNDLLELSEEFLRDSKNEFESAMVNESSVFESMKFYCIYSQLELHKARCLWLCVNSTDPDQIAV